MNSCLQTWPEPIIPVQSLSNSGIKTIPDRYIKRTDYPIRCPESDANIPIIDFSQLDHDQVLRQVSNACREWGFFQVVNHGVSVELMKNMRQIWREFFHLPIEEKLLYANTPATYEGYGSRIGVEKGSKLDWSDYFYLNYLPLSARDTNKWPRFPLSCRELIIKYGEELIKLCGKLMKILSKNLELEEDHLQKAFGGEEIEASLRANFYPKCPQPDLALGLSPHSDPGAMTILLPDDNVAGLQVRKGDSWITVKPIPNAFIVNIGDQLQVHNCQIYF